METRGAAQRAAEQRQAAEELTQNWLQRQGPYAAAALAQIQRNNQDTYGYDRFGYEEIEPGPVARATDSTFSNPAVTLKPRCPFLPECLACAPSRCKSTTTCTRVNSNRGTFLKSKRSLSLLFYKGLPTDFLDNNISSPSSSIEPLMKHRRITRSYARRMQNDTRTNLFEKVLDSVFEGGFLHWYEFMRLRGVNKGCLALWHDKKEIAGPWKLILKELNALNGTNKCHRCEQVILLKKNRELCAHMSQCANSNKGCSRNGMKKRKLQYNVWNEVSAKRTPDFVSCVDILMSSGVLNWRERGGIRRICKATYKVHKEQCTCRKPIDRSTSLPFLEIDPRYQIGYYEDWTDYERCMAMIRYTLSLKSNLHSFYNFHHVTDPDCLPYGLARWNWFDIQMVNLQSNCPKRYAFTMHLVSLFIAQGELQRFPPVWYADAFVGTQHRPYADSFVESLASTITEYCLPGKCFPHEGLKGCEIRFLLLDRSTSSSICVSNHRSFPLACVQYFSRSFETATDEVICNFLRTRCYPTSQTQTLLGPLSKNLSIFSPFFCMVPLDDKQKTNLPKCLEELDEELIDSMSMDLLCSIM